MTSSGACGTDVCMVGRRRAACPSVACESQLHVRKSEKDEQLPKSFIQSLVFLCDPPDLRVGRQAPSGAGPPPPPPPATDLRCVHAGRAVSIRSSRRGMYEVFLSG